MKPFVNFFLLGLAFCLASLVGAAPPPIAADVQSAMDKVDLRSDHYTFNVALPQHNHSADAVKARGYDPSTEYQEWATVEIWTGGSTRKPVNYGDTRGASLSDKVFALLDNACPWTGGGFLGARCNDHDWKFFWTNAVVEGDPAWRVELRKAWIKTESAYFATEGVRTVLAHLVADTLRAFAKQSKGRNCYDVPGEAGGIYCNVPQFVRVNLPWSNSIPQSEQKPGMNYMAVPNHWHVETWGADDKHQFSPFGQLRPCRTRNEVDEVMDKYQGDLVREFPKWKGKFRRDARVIIDGAKVCSTEP